MNKPLANICVDLIRAFSHDKATIRPYLQGSKLTLDIELCDWEVGEYLIELEWANVDSILPIYKAALAKMEQVAKEVGTTFYPEEEEEQVDRLNRALFG